MGELVMPKKLLSKKEEDTEAPSGSQDTLTVITAGGTDCLTVAGPAQESRGGTGTVRHTNFVLFPALPNTD